MPSLRVLNWSFECPLPYGQGHICTASEAGELNRLRTARVAALARKAIAEGSATKEKLERMAYVYEFRGGPFTMQTDPVEIEAMKIAKSIVQTYAAKHSLRTEDLSDFAERVAQVAQREDVQSEAARRIRRLREVTAESLDISFEEGNTP